MDESNDKQKDALERRCPRLGHEVGFAYCRQCGDDGLPCWKTVDCWWEYFDIVRYLRDHFSEDIVVRLLQPAPKPKTTQLVELIAQAQQRLDEV